ncbi:hypothetical protein DFH08DRAFT_1074993 [Mycena albidolilacea]|uniref:Peptidase S33 tripeptidyl aminopeptidase-like C-terminal domain-containing protein n=1 Tax=Mycena albidolilacea TaxID=1033008 RepID=A0AAD7AI92_9AGAR|nr:hypothetical protein DFH08DRAFT_1074993 [Mycena albidolilacea]
MAFFRHRSCYGPVWHETPALSVCASLHEPFQDHITPLRNAKKMSKAFTGSVVLMQDCPGHTSLAGASPCTWGYIREYFLNGTLPDNDTVCPVLGSLFPNPGATGLQEHEQTVFSAARRGGFRNCTVKCQA